MCLLLDSVQEDDCDGHVCIDGHDGMDGDVCALAVVGVGVGLWLLVLLVFSRMSASIFCSNICIRFCNSVVDGDTGN
jgi:hypothetical protein